MQRQFTATAFVVDSRGRVLLLWHRKLKRWMPPGGHIDQDELPEETARRECKEETGLDVDIVGDAQPDLFDEASGEGRMIKKPIAFMLEEIPALEERKQPAHQHMDFLYLARPLDEKQIPVHDPKESDDMRWFSRAEVQHLDEKTEIFANVKRYILFLLPEPA